MGLLFGGYVSKEASAAFRGRWEKAVRWFRSTYPKLAVQEKCCGPLMIGTGTTCPQDAQEGSGSGWQAVVVGNVADCSLNASDVADLIDVRKVAEKLLREDGRFGAVLWDGGAASAFIVTDWAGWYPIFWAKCNEAMIFSSHLGLLLRLVEPRPQLDPMGVAEQLMMGYQLDARTLFEGISVLRPGEMLLLHSG
ncbi:MAG: hypothetical protein KAV00_06750, partial [Phycisphaerae bacterium]|nr:hypothetical protein [Phycisphaerae bacterium]